MRFFSTGECKRPAVAMLTEHSDVMGRMVNVTRWTNPVPEVPWVLDNGAYGAFVQGSDFDGDLFMRTLGKVPEDNPPLWVVCPDIVGCGEASLEFSLGWRPRLPARFDYLLAVQEGMEPYQVAQVLDGGRFVGLFVGGASKEWKLRTAPLWVRLAHERGLICHVGRISADGELSYCKRIGVDSVDSSTPAQKEGGWPEAKKEYRRIIATLRGEAFQDVLVEATP